MERRAPEPASVRTPRDQGVVRARHGRAIANVSGDRASHALRGDPCELVAGRSDHTRRHGARRRDRGSGGLRRRRRREAPLRRGRRRAAGRPAARLPGVLVRLAAADRAARGGGLPRRRARPAGLQPVVASRTASRAYGADKLAADVHGLIQERGAESALRGRHDWGGTVAWTLGDEPSRGRRPSGHPQRGPSAAAQRGTAPPQPAPTVLVLLLLPAPGAARAPSSAPTALAVLPGTSCATRGPPYTPEEIERYVEAWSQPGAATAMINYYRGAVRHSPKQAKAALRPISAPTLVIWGQRDRYLGPEPRRAPPRRCAQSRPRRAPARRLALGPPRRGRARHTNSSSTSSSPPARPKTAQPRWRGANRLSERAPTRAHVLARGDRDVARSAALLHDRVVRRRLHDVLDAALVVPAAHQEAPIAVTHAAVVPTRGRRRGRCTRGSSTRRRSRRGRRVLRARRARAADRP